MKVDFVCIGPQRSATSWLDRVFRIHPQIQMPNSVKETFFLDVDFDKGWSWYFHKYFSSYESGILIGEIAPTLFSDLTAISRLHTHNPNAKIIILLRDPIARTLSLFEHFINTGRVPNHFDDATRIAPSILRSSDYCSCLQSWLSEFHSSQILIISTKSIEDNPDKVLEYLTQFLGVDEFTHLSGSLKGRYGSAVTPRNKVVFLFFHRFARLLRKAGFHGLVSFGKDIGIKRLFGYGGNRLTLNISSEQLSKLSHQFNRSKELVELVDSHVAMTALSLQTQYGFLL